MFLSFLLSAAPAGAAAQTEASTGETSTRLEARRGGADALRCRLSVECPVGSGELRAFVDEESSSGGNTLLGFGLAVPGFELGPMREAGLLSALNHPAAIGSMSEHTTASLDRSFDRGTLNGGVVRFGGSAGGHRIVELYGISRAGLAPEGTRTGGVFLTTGIDDTLTLGVASKMTLFGTRGEQGEWFLSAPEVGPSNIFRTGGRLRYRGRVTNATLSAGVAFSDCTRPAPFVTCAAGLAGELATSEAHPVYSIRLDAGAVDRGYIGDDGRFTPRTLLVRPSASFRMAGMNLTGWYRWDFYRLPLMPVFCRRAVHDGSIAGEVRFGPLCVGARLKPHVEYAEDGRTLLRVECGPRARLYVGRFVVESELELTRSNVNDPSAGALLGVSRQWERGMAGIRIDVTEGKGRLRTDVALVGKKWRLSASLAAPDLIEVDFGAPRVALVGGLDGVLRRSTWSVSFDVES